ncbi:NUDIX domain-containing protein [Rhodovulum sp. BSW8]|uniref:8-oxo-dGTP diphosphatase n=1 Tax=Rhodovulum visakhapatnamense TaxID=364297 RepID=A0A4R8FEJ0_9RHOB|nr:MULTISPECIES: NUDIX hydrolase [Rhodovulum]OLS43545.1 DNA mismatch repair protein MutT [Rhodovulum sulfidophilum]MBL3571749.1 NUDIX hydrolase [Rhodovulum visakhapatnamense]MBL3577650.1 NUDIX hydrolase [Rhodovulum visakhapatnamense]RBO53975.1 NUDIX domain-containing protein [Rhodovulum sp. BSW8]TDX24294.1 8-oxo-dGTP diphosphatase [Rhodovulum visakhapatnamense]
MKTDPFDGAKLALLTGRGLVSILRDDVPHISWPGHWDFPGGAREGRESPADCALRETREELGLVLDPARLVWQQVYRNGRGRPVWFFVARLEAAEIARIRFGDEGQGWAVMPVADYLAHPKGIGQLKDRLSDYLAARPGDAD